MTTFQTVAKYVAIALAILLIGTIVSAALSLCGIFGAIGEEEALPKELQKLPISQDFSSLEAQIGAADFSVRQGEVFSLESNLEKLEVTQANGTLVIRQETVLGWNPPHASLVLTVPDGAVLDSVRMFTGAGRVVVEALSARNIYLELGAGEARLERLTALNSAEIHGGAGKIAINGSELWNLELEMGMGQLEMTAALRGECELDLGVGETVLTLLGPREEYSVEIDKGLGTVEVDGVSATDFSLKGSQACRLVDIDGGVGAVRLWFTEKKA